MKVIFTGTGKSGSWKIRGEQLGAAMRARVEPRCLDFSGCNVAVYVKRVRPDVLEAMRRQKVRWVWDIVDAWPQPEGNLWNADQALSWLRSQLAYYQPTGVVFATQAMKEDSGWEGPSLVLPHHAWSKYSRRKVGAYVKVVAYEGHRHYLGAFEERVQQECSKRKWRFDINPDMQQVCDIGVALRDFNGHPARRWKSNVKLANLQALGVPALCSPESGYYEFARGGEVFLDERGLSQALDACASDEMRRRAQQVEPVTLQQVAREYLEWLTALSS